MRVAHCLGWYFPESVGGTEVYVRDLARALHGQGIESVVLAPRDGHETARYEHEGVRVLRYPVPEARTRAEHEGREPHAAFDAFRALLTDAAADVFHLHSVTYGANLHHLECARAAGMASVTTVHVGDVLCERGTLLRFGREACDGRIDPTQCVPCWLDAKGVPHALAPALGAIGRHLPDAIAERVPGRARTLLSAGARIDARRARLLRLAAASDRVVAVCDWLHAALRLNGVPDAKLVACRQGVAPVDAAKRGALLDALLRRPLRVAFLGRASPVKGLDLLLDALARVPDASVRLAVYARANGPDDRAYLARMHDRAASDARVSFVDLVPPEGVRDAIRRHDVLAVPSRCLETGPLVAMEALAAGIPVLASDLGGLRELVRHERTGWLLPPDDVRAWSDALQRLAATRPALTWTPEESPLLTHAEVASRMAALYRTLR